jgi:hypothetical protein
MKNKDLEKRVKELEYTLYWLLNSYINYSTPPHSLRKRLRDMMAKYKENGLHEYRANGAAGDQISSGEENQ